MSDTHVSVLTPVYNGEQYLTSCIEGVLAQTHRNFTLTIVDNRSTDSTPDIAEGFARADSRIRYIRHEEFVDVTENHNRAFRIVDADSAFVKIAQAETTCSSRSASRRWSTSRCDLRRSGWWVGYRLCNSLVELVGLPFPHSVASGEAILRQSLLGGPYRHRIAELVALSRRPRAPSNPVLRPEFAHADTEAAYWAFTQADFRSGSSSHHVLAQTAGEPEQPRLAGAELLAREHADAPPLRAVRSLGHEFRSRLRYELSVYLWFHAKQRIKPSRRHDRDFHTFHRRMLKLLRSESGDDREVELVTAAIGALLADVGEASGPLAP